MRNATNNFIALFWDCNYGETFALPDFLEPKQEAIESTILNRKK